METHLLETVISEGSVWKWSFMVLLAKQPAAPHPQCWSGNDFITPVVAMLSLYSRGFLQHLQKEAMRCSCYQGYYAIKQCTWPL